MRVYPDYYKDFKCIGGACRHNCCIGWEIDIDEETLALYDTVDGEMGERLQKSISRTEEPHFILGAGERCPFLNKHNLCDIIAHLGEDCLCDICAAHPRFVNEIEGRIELGLGLCCEAAGALILGQKEPMRLCDTGAPVTPATAERDEVIALLQKREISLCDRLCLLRERYGVEDTFETAVTARRYLALERLDEEWTRRLERLLSPIDGPLPDREREYEQFAVYLIYRHFIVNDPAATVAFVTQAVQLLMALGAAKLYDTGSFTLADQVELCRLFSSEVEYSEENIKALI